MRLLKVFLALGLLVCVQAAQAGVITDDVVIYDGTPIADAGVTLSGWGSGDAAESTLRGSVMESRQASIRIFSDNLYSGGRIEFAKGVKLFSRGDKADGKYLVFMMRFPSAPGSNPNLYGGAMGLWNQTGSLSVANVAKADTLRFVFTEESGAKYAVKRTRGAPSTPDGWVSVGIPVSRLRLPAGKEDYVLKSVVVCSDVSSQVVNGASGTTTGAAGGAGATGGPGAMPGMAGGGAGGIGTGGLGGLGSSGTVTGGADRRVFQSVEMNVGQIKTVIDTDPIKCNTPKQVYNPRAINEILVQVEADGGMASLTYTWDFGDGTVPATGTNQGSHIYTKPGDYKITLTVSDNDGVKQPVTRTLSVELEW